MTPQKTRYIALCQQLLVLGAVFAALVPAASVVSLDVVADGERATSPAAGASAAGSAYAREASQPSVVPDEAVDATVREVSLTAPAGEVAQHATGKGGLRLVSGTPGASAVEAEVVADEEEGTTTVTSDPQDVEGYGAVGVTWSAEDEIADDEISFQVRTKKDGDWSAWQKLEYHDEHGPDPDSEEAEHARPGTDESLVGDVDQVQVRSEIQAGQVPSDMKLAVIAPGDATSEKKEMPALDTAKLSSATTGTSDPGEGDDAGPGTTEPVDLGSGAEGDGPAAAAEATDADGTDDPAIALQAASYTPKPKIYSRAQWGADERMRDKSSLHYYEVHAGFVHHTVNANNYTAAQVPGIIRSIYAYHTKSRGWSDIGYNFLVDRFGRIWEGRYGGVDRPVVGAHTEGYNDYAFAASAIGNYDTAKPSSAMVQAYGALFGWKLSLHGVSASSTRQWVGKKYFQAISGHRDAKSTACPGRYLYAQIPAIRRLAAAAQKGWGSRDLHQSLAGTGNPDIIARRRSDGRGVILQLGGVSAFGSSVATSWPGTVRAVPSGDLTGDGKGDLLAVGSDGTASVHPGNGAGRFAAGGVKRLAGFSNRTLLTAVGDLDGDGRNDVVGRSTTNGRLAIYRGDGRGGFSAAAQALTGLTSMDLLVGNVDVNEDGRRDLLGRDTAGRLWVYRGTGRGSFDKRVALGGSWAAYSSIVGMGDANGDGHSDLLVTSRSSKVSYLLPGRGRGAFGKTRGPYNNTANVDAVLGAAQVAGSAAYDLVVKRGSSVLTLPANGRFDLGRPLLTNLDLRGKDLVLNAGDWDRDGRGDVITRTASTGYLYLHRGNGQGQFVAPILINTAFKGVGLVSVVADMTGDGYPDLMGQKSTGGLRIFPGRGRATLGTSYVAHGRVSATRQFGTGRWNGDGSPDTMFRSGDAIVYYPGNGPGGLTSGAGKLAASLRGYDWVIGVGDIDGGAGRPDLVVRAASTGYLYVLQGTGSGGFAGRRILGDGLGGYDLAG